MGGDGGGNVGCGGGLLLCNNGQILEAEGNGLAVHPYAHMLCQACKEAT